MFCCIGAANIDKLRELTLRFYESNNIPAALLCLDHIFDKTPIFDDITYPEVTPSLHLFSDYIHFVRCISCIDLDDHDALQKLFGIRFTGDELISLPLDMLPFGQSPDVSKTTFQDLFKKSVLHRMRARIAALVDATAAEGFLLHFCGPSTYEVRSPRINTVHSAQTKGELQAIRSSIFEACNNLTPNLGRPGTEASYDAEFLSRFMKLVTMSFAFGGDEASSHLPDSNDSQTHPRRLMIGEESVTELFVSSIRAESQDSILDGIKFLQFVSFFSPFLRPQLMFLQKIRFTKETDGGRECTVRFHGLACRLHHTLIPFPWKRLATPRRSSPNLASESLSDISQTRRQTRRWSNSILL